MSDMTPFERRLTAAMQTYVGPRRSVDGEAITRAAEAVAPRRRVIGARMDKLADDWRVPWRLVGAIGVAGALLATGVFVGSQRPAPPAHNDMIAYSSGSDIYVGDPVTGRTTAIVTGPDVDSGPKFSPDGSRIAFLRGDPRADSAIVVVKADGSDERVAVPAGYSRRGIGFAWTPDGGSLLVNHDRFPFTTPSFDGELSLFDASGVAEPRPLTPPLPLGPGGGYFPGDAQVAPMFRPPDGDVILSSGPAGELYAWDVNLKSHTQLGAEGLKPFAPYTVEPWSVSWSMNGSQIALELVRPVRPGGVIGFFVMNADGTDVRRRDPDVLGVSWSPDNTKLALNKCSTDPTRPGAVIVVVDLASGQEHEIAATAVETKTEGVVPGRPMPIPAPGTIERYCGWYSSPTARTWDYEGWSWTPDSKAIVVLETHGMRPLVVDVETGASTELPWEADSAPSWRQVPGR